MKFNKYNGAIAMSTVHSAKGFRNVVDLISLINEGGYQFSWKAAGMWYPEIKDDVRHYVKAIILHAESKDRQMRQSFNFAYGCLCDWDDADIDELDALLKKRTTQFKLKIVLVNGNEHLVPISSISMKATSEALVTSWVTADGQKHRFVQSALTSEEVKEANEQSL